MRRFGMVSRLTASYSSLQLGRQSSQRGDKSIALTSRFRAQRVSYDLGQRGSCKATRKWNGGVLLLLRADRGHKHRSLSLDRRNG